MREDASSGKSPDVRNDVFRFGRFEFDAAAGFVYSDEEETLLPPKAAGVLRLLLEKTGELVTKDRLLEEVWADAVVTESSLTDAISLLRQVLGDDARDPSYIQTLHRRGYRFIAAVQAEATAPVEADGADPPTVERPPPRGRLEAGARLGNYEIIEVLGAGGMGSVYRARDAVLEREVAIKLLPEDFGNDPERIARLEREAKLLAAVSHTNIATIHTLEESGGVKFPVMELVEGDTLEQRLRSGAPKVEEALQIARQIASALEAAHERGIIHRDLKPANIKLAHGGQVKVLDFGLAKSIEVRAFDAAATESPTATLAIQATGRGTIVGTAAYMSPEQARGQDVDGRSDIWAFGCVLYEMLAGRNPFVRRDVHDTLAAVLRDEPDWRALPAATPAPVRALLRRCLTREPDRRWHHAADVRIEIEEALTEISGSGRGEPPVAVIGRPGAPRDNAPDPGPALAQGRSGRRNRLELATVAMLALLLGMVLSWAAGRLIGAGADAPAGMWHLGFEVGVPVWGVEVSPDGQDFFYIALAPDDVPRLYHRPGDRREAQEIAGGEYTRRMAFSPDGEWLALMTQDLEIKKLAVDEQRVFDVGDFDGLLEPSRESLEGGYWAGVGWASDDTLVLGTGQGGLWLLSASGGTPWLLVADENERFGYPDRLPGSDTIVAARDTPNPDRPSEIILVDLESGEVTPLGIEGAHPRYVDSGHILFGRDYGQTGGNPRVAGTLFAVPFDAEALTPTGQPAPTTVHPAVHPFAHAAYFDVSTDGTLVYVPEMPLPSRSLVWVDQNGNEEPASQQRAAYRTPSLSSDGARVTYRRQELDGNYQVWIHDLPFDEATRLTSDGSISPEWSSDDTFIYGSAHSGSADRRLFRHRADFAGEAELITDYSSLTEDLTLSTILIEDVAPTDDLMVIGVQLDGRSRDLYLLDAAGDRRPRPFMTGNPFYGYARFSPDGNSLAYSMARSGGASLYVQEFPEGEPVRVSPGEGRWPLWSPDGDEIYYWSGDGWIMAATVRTEPQLSVGEPRRLFESTGYTSGGSTEHWDIAPDGRFLMLEEHQSLPPLARVHVVLNWLEDLERIVPGVR